VARDCKPDSEAISLELVSRDLSEGIEEDSEREGDNREGIADLRRRTARFIQTRLGRLWLLCLTCLGD
jgi:hypothetical protein